MGSRARPWQRTDVRGFFLVVKSTRSGEASDGAKEGGASMAEGKGKGDVDDAIGVCCRGVALSVLLLSRIVLVAAAPSSLCCFCFIALWHRDSCRGQHGV